MGPNYLALLRFHLAAGQHLAAQAKLETVMRDVRLQQTKVAQLERDSNTAHHKAVEIAAKAANLDGDMKQREARIEQLRVLQQTVTNNKEYQALIVDINTQKLDKGKIEDEALKQMEAASAQKKLADETKAKLEAEKSKLKDLLASVDVRAAQVKAEIASLEGPMNEAAASVPTRYMDAYKRTAKSFDDDTMVPIEKPNARVEDYLCTGCNTYLVVDIYNRIHTRDDIVQCPSCNRILYIPEDLPPEKALKKKVAPVVKKEKVPGATPKKRTKKSIGTDGLGAPRERTATDISGTVDANLESATEESPAEESPA
ncbi:MAG TPA: C4-type zinc ribbon domain-containing protein, partial [Tepidisphaeraceae bacterium]|nr:C4-type zinc ribbon domain-containing protein [Tepidisphaeraceae bacterium]